MLKRFRPDRTLGRIWKSAGMVDGEIVSLDAQGARLSASAGIAEEAAGLTYAVFDLLYADGKDLRSTRWKSVKRCWND